MDQTHFCIVLFLYEGVREHAGVSRKIELAVRGASGVVLSSCQLVGYMGTLIGQPLVVSSNQVAMGGELEMLLTRPQTRRRLHVIHFS